MAIWLVLVLSISLQASQTHSLSKEQSHSGQRPTEETHSQRIEDLDLKMYLHILDEREKQLAAMNQSLLNEAHYSFVKIPLFMIKAGIDGYLLGRMAGSGSATTAAQTALSTSAQKAMQSKVKSWLAQGGLEKLKRLGFNVGLLGAVTTNDSALIEGHQWEYRIPIYGTAKAAYTWSDRLMKSPEIIEKNGNEILALRKEKNRIRSILDHISLSHE